MQMTDRTPVEPARRRLATVLGALGLVAVLATGCSSGGDDEADEPTSTTEAEATTTTEADDGTTTTGNGEGAEAVAWADDPQQHRGEIGETFTVECPEDGEPDQVWGAGIYTDDSSVCTAAVQSGLITLEDGGEVTYEIAEGEDEYEGGTANDITSLRYGAWQGSFTFPDAPPGSVEFEVGQESWTENATDHADEVGTQVTVPCSPDGQPGSVWGSDPYTADSSVCTAAVHAGLITVEDGGNVAIEITPGEDAYEGTEANGITTNEYGAYGASFTFPQA